MAKYIIDVKDGETLYKAVIAPDGEPYITPAMGNVYTEPDLEQVRCAAYEEGRNSLLIEVQKAGKNTIKLEEDEYYQRGLADAWDAARTLWNTPNRKEIFGHTTFNTVLTTLTAQEAIEKIRQYEQKKQEEDQQPVP